LLLFICLACICFEMVHFTCPGCGRDTWTTETSLDDHQRRRKCYPEINGFRAIHMPTYLDNYLVARPAIKKGEAPSSASNVDELADEDIDDDGVVPPEDDGDVDSNYGDLPSDEDDEGEAPSEDGDDEEGVEGDVLADDVHDASQLSSQGDAGGASQTPPRIPSTLNAAVVTDNQSG